MFQSFPEVDQNVWSPLATIYFNVGQIQLYKQWVNLFSEMMNSLRLEYNTN